MKKLLSVTFGVLLMSTSVFATEVNVVVNDKPIEKQGVIIDGRTMVPVRGVFEELGYEVSWDADTKTASLVKETSQISMSDGEAFFMCDGKEITPDVPQQIVDGSFMLPLRAVSEAIGAEVDWDSETKTASVSIAADNQSDNNEADDNTKADEKETDIRDFIKVEIINPDDPIFDELQIEDIVVE